MIYKTLLFVLILSSPLQLNAQASWSYGISFQLQTTDGRSISKADFTNNDIRLFSISWDGAENHTLEFDSLTRSFLFSEHTIGTSAVLAFIHQNDTTILHIQSTDMDLETIVLTGHSYTFRVWNHEDQFICWQNNSKKRRCKIKHPFNYYQTEERTYIDFSQLVEVEID